MHGCLLWPGIVASEDIYCLALSILSITYALVSLYLWMSTPAQKTTILLPHKYLLKNEKIFCWFSCSPYRHLYSSSDFTLRKKMKVNKHRLWTATKYWPFFFIAKHILLVGNIKNKACYPCAMKSQPLSINEETDANCSLKRVRINVFLPELSSTRILLLPSRLPCPSSASLSLTPMGWVPIVNGFLPNLLAFGTCSHSYLWRGSSDDLHLPEDHDENWFPNRCGLGQSLMS